MIVMFLGTTHLGHQCPERLESRQVEPNKKGRCLNAANLPVKFLDLLLELAVLLVELLVLGLPLVTLVLKGLDLALEVAGLDVGLSQPVMIL